MDAASARQQSGIRRAARWLGAAYLVALAFIALWPTPVDRAASGSISRVLAFLHAQGVPLWFDYRVVEFTANIALFVPVGLLGVVLLGRRDWLLAIALGFTASVAIELSQLVFLPGRFATPMDVLANTLGAAVGALVAVVALRLVPRRTSVEAA